MAPIRKILVPTDFSAPSSEAVGLAEDLARRYEASLTLLHVIQPPMVPPEAELAMINPESMAEIEEACARDLATLKRELIARGVKNVNAFLEKGTPFNEIIRLAQDGKYDLVIVGTHGRAGLARVFLGSVAEKVVHRAPCSVLTVRAPQ